MAKITATYQRGWHGEQMPCSIADAVTGSAESADRDGELERLSERLTKLAEIVGALAEYAVRSGDTRLATDLNNAMHYRYSIEVE